MFTFIKKHKRAVAKLEDALYEEKEELIIEVVDYLIPEVPNLDLTGSISVIGYELLADLTNDLVRMNQNYGLIHNDELLGFDSLKTNLPTNIYMSVAANTYFSSDGKFYIDQRVSILSFLAELKKFTEMMLEMRGYDTGYQRFNYRAQVKMLTLVVSPLVYMLNKT